MNNLDTVHKIGELAAAIAVVLSLLFVGYEVQQNSIAQKQLATRSLVRDWSDAVATLEDPNLACLSHRLSTDAANLTIREANQIGTAFWRIYKAHEELHYQYEQGMIDELVWNGFKRTAADTMSTRGMRDWWRSYRSLYSERFADYVDDLIAETKMVVEAPFLRMSCDDVVGKEYWN
jgi:hypothetical protein